MDSVKNFAKVTVSTGYNESAVTIVLTTGHGAKFPDPATEGAFNLVWFNGTDYADPSDDPNVEIVRCTARSTDTLTVTRGQEGIASQTHNTGGKVYQMAIVLTKKTYDDINDGKFKRLQLDNPTVKVGDGVLLKHASQYACEVDAGQNLSFINLNFKNNETTPAGSFFWGIVLNHDSDALDVGGAIGITNSGKCDSIYLSIKGKAGAVASSPTGIGLDLNRGPSDAENSNLYTGFGIQIYDWSTTNISGGPCAIYLKKQGNLNNDHVLQKFTANRKAIFIETPEGGGYDATQMIFGIGTSLGAMKSYFNAGGGLVFGNSNLVEFVMQAGNSGAIWADSGGPWLRMKGGTSGIQFVNNAINQTLLQLNNDGSGLSFPGTVSYLRQGTLKQWTYQGSVVDDATFDLPAITNSAFGWVTAGSNEERTLFTINATGTVTLISNSANVVANADTDAKLCIGTAATQEPLTIRNRLGNAKNINLVVWYD